MPTHHDETLLQRYQREHRDFERIAMSGHTDGKLCVSSKHPCIIKMHDFMGETDVMIASASGMTNSGFFPTDDEAIANASRLVAAWNACEGLSTALLENIVMVGDTLNIRFDALSKEESARIAERDLLSAINAELLEALKPLSLATDEGDDAAQGTHYVDKVGVIRCKGSFLEAVEKARAAIAKAQGEQP